MMPQQQHEKFTTYNRTRSFSLKYNIIFVTCTVFGHHFLSLLLLLRCATMTKPLPVSKKYNKADRSSEEKIKGEERCYVI